MRKMLYASLLAEFGAHRTWKGSRYPTDKRQQFRSAMRKLAGIFSELAKKNITPEAVEQQVDWAITVQKDIKSQGHARQFILNKAAALEIGFIVASDLPGFMSVSKGAGRSRRQQILDQL